MGEFLFYSRDGNLLKVRIHQVFYASDRVNALISLGFVTFCLADKRREGMHRVLVSRSLHVDLFDVKENLFG